ncbi:GntR family transcriptional regulator [Acidovorax sp. SRB_24]|uniref:GntR family transcriptional regulator n=1 Tax=Acidovorax sp. SRB_24 TaxID=1962700 RepID=UPI00197FEAC8|nr:GntR family transcriptional regulator [Acidovorax sp. SRB_24]
MSRNPGTLLHRQLFLVLRDQITRGMYLPGTLIPKEDELCEMFGVSRITVRRAVSDLEQLGLVKKQQGRGTFVCEPKADKRLGTSLSFLDALTKTSRDTVAKVLIVETQRAPGAIALQLRLDAGAQAVHAVRLRSANNVPLVLTDAWVPEYLGKHVTRSELRKRPLFEILLAEGITFARVVQEVTAVAADPNMAGLLTTDVGSPLLRITRVIYDEGQRPVEHLTAYVSPERSRVLMELPHSAINTLSAGRITHDLMV